VALGFHCVLVDWHWGKGMDRGGEGMKGIDG